MNPRSRIGLWGGTAWFLLALALSLIVLAPASLVGRALEHASEGRLTLAASQGRIWSGRGTLLAVHDGAQILIDWNVAPARLVVAELAGTLRIGAAEPVPFVASRGRLTLERFDVVLPAALIAAAIGPYQGYRIAGTVRARAERAVLASAGLQGRASLEWRDAASALIAVAPLGSYRAEIDANVDGASVRLLSTSGPLLLDGAGRWARGGANLELTARTDGSRADTLKSWLRSMTPELPDGSFRFVWPQPAKAQRGPRS